MKCTRGPRMEPCETPSRNLRISIFTNIVLTKKTIIANDEFKENSSGSMRSKSVLAAFFNSDFACVFSTYKFYRMSVYRNDSFFPLS